MGKALTETSEEKRIAHEIAWEQCQDVCDSGDIAGIRKAFETGRLTKDDLEICLGIYLKEAGLEVIRCLLEQEMDPNQLSLQILLSDCSFDKIKLLAEFGLDIKSVGHNFLPTNLHNLEIIDWLLDNGADPNATMTVGPTCFWTNAGGGQHDDTSEVLNRAAALGDIPMFDHLVIRGAIPSRSIALHTASKCKDSSQAGAMVYHLVQKYNLDVNADDLCRGLRWFHSLGNGPPDSGSPLACAVKNRSVGAVKALLECGADVENYFGIPGATYHANGHDEKGLLLRNAIRSYTRWVELDGNKVTDKEIARRCEEFIQSLGAESKTR
ncbi:hypothetical protein B0J14DRAFT_604506 [Halenospora varia]|nr:hypothetical protein B0J14DRAFT_604506 [Halenospora varia]